MTPTDILGWLDASPYAIVLLLILGSICALLEGTDRGKRLMDAAIRRIERP